MDENMTFEAAMKRLEEITNLIQSSEISLDESLKLYQEGLQLANYCHDKLKTFTESLEEIQKDVNQD